MSSLLRQFVKVIEDSVNEKLLRLDHDRPIETAVIYSRCGFLMSALFASL
ncbi:hypothetical protein [Symmachiella dynata]|nr:hypothetical protein [Symmachiella dynata]